MERRFCGVVLVISSLGCSSDPVDIGDDKSGENLADYAASWDGYAEAYEFPSGSNRIRVVLDTAGHGTVEFGDAPPWPPPTDPEVPYPELGYDAATWIFAGFKYPIREIRVEGRRIRFGVSTYDVSREWCELQTPMLHPDSPPDEPYYQCTSSLTTEDVNTTCHLGDALSPQLRVECTRFMLCQGVCRCTADDCEVDTPARLEDYTIRLDAALAGQASELVGTLLASQYPPPDRITVRLTRQ